MSNLMTSAQVKVLLGLESDDDTYDDLFTRYLPIVTAWFEAYCDRGLAPRDITDEEIFSNRSRRIYLWAFPINSLASVNVDGTMVAGASYIVNKNAGYILPGTSRPQVEEADLLKVTYNGGYADGQVPSDLALAFATCVGVKAGVAGVSASSGGSGAIKQIGLGGGALSVSFDTAQAQGGIAGTYDVSNIPVEVQPYASVLDRYTRQRV